MTSNDPIRFTVPLYTVADAARIVGFPASTLASWAQGYVRTFSNRPSVAGSPIITHLQAVGQRQPTIPFVGLAEALVLAAVRKSGVPMQRIRPALHQLQADIGLDYALASRSCTPTAPSCSSTTASTTRIPMKHTWSATWSSFGMASECSPK